MPPVYFYIPQDDWPSVSISTILKVEDIDAYLQSPSFQSCIYHPVYCWILQTYLRLRENGFPGTLVGTLPHEGIVIAYWDSVPIDFKPSAKLLIVGIIADGIYPHPYTQIRVVQNQKAALKFSSSYYIPLWTQPGLIPRSASRGDRFETIAFFGAIPNLAPELQSPSWQAQLQELGLNWYVVEPDRWHDYSDVDAVLAVRSFDKRDYFQKPATKLFNAWHAGVPAILGCESAYRAERQSDLDYIEVSSPDEVLAALKRLRDDPELRQSTIANGRLRAKETSVENLTARWGNFITQVAMPAYEAWCSASYVTQQSLFMQRFLAKKINGLNHRFKKVFTPAR
jgi:hypothetical protein